MIDDWQSITMVCIRGPCISLLIINHINSINCLRTIDIMTDIICNFLKT